MSLSRLVLERRVALTVAYIAVTVAGISALFVIPVDLLPCISVPRLVVRTLAPGIAAGDLERSVTIPLEAAVQGIQGLKRTTAVTREGISVVTAEFSWSTDPGSALLEIRERVERTVQHLPAGIRAPTVLHVDPLEEPLLTVAMAPSRPHACEETLVGTSELASGIFRRRLERVDGVGMVTIAGCRQRVLGINADPDRLCAAGLVPADLMEALRSSAVCIPMGEAIRDSRGATVILATEFRGPASPGAILLRTRPGGVAVRLGDVARVDWTVAEPAGRFHVNGREVVELKIMKEPAANAIATAARVREELKRLGSEYPDVACAVVTDESAFIRRTASDVIDAALVGGGLAFGVLFLVLRNWRDPLVVGVSFPVSVLGTVFVLQVLGMTLNVVSLAGLALGVGMLGDNAVIVVENIRRYVDRGLPVRQAVMDGATRITIPAAVSTLTNVAVFLPVLFLDGVGRRLFGEMAVSMSAALLVSLVVATTLVPMLMDRFPSAAHPRGRRQLRATAGRIVAGYIRWSMQRNRLVVAAATGVLVASTVVAFGLEPETSPALDDAALSLTLDFPPSTPLREMLDRIEPFESSLSAVPGIAGVYTEIGTPEEADVWSVGSSSPQRVCMLLVLDRGAQAGQVSDRVRRSTERLARQVVGLRTSLGPRSTSFDRLLDLGNRRIALRITGVEDDAWARTSADVRRLVAAVPGVFDVTAPDDSPVTPAGVLCDWDAAGRLGIPASLVEAALDAYRGLTFPLPVTDDGQSIHVRFTVGEGNKPTGPETVRRGWIVEGGGMVSLGALVKNGWVSRNTEMRREDGHRVFLVTANCTPGMTSRAFAGLREAVGRAALPPGSAISVGLSSREASDSTAGIWVAMALSVAVMYLLLAAEYASALLPLVILASSPIAFVGAVAALALTGEPAGILSLAGLIITLGAVDNDAVIAIDLIAEKVRAGDSLVGATVEGMMVRMRPILVTSLTTILGIAPLLMRTGSGSVLVRSLAIPLTGGLIASTIATVMVIPAVIALAGTRLRLFPAMTPCVEPHHEP